MKKSVSLGALSLAFLGCSSPPVDEVAHGKEVAAARQALDDRQYDEALAITDQLLAANAEDREALLLAAEGNIALFEADRSGQEYFLQDAITNLRRALNLSEGDPEDWERLGDLYLQNSQFAKGRDAALEAAKLWRSRDASAAVVCNAVMLAAANEMQMFVEARRPELETEEQEVQPETAQLAAAVMARCEFARSGQPGRAVILAGQMYLWLDKGQQALEIYERGLDEVPGDADLNDAFQNLYAKRGMQAECVAAYDRLLTSQPGNSLLLWHKGRAEVAHGNALRRRSQPAQAMAVYGHAVETFGRYRALNPQHHANTDHWLAICNISRTKVALDTADTDAAQEYSLASFRNTPRVTELDGNGNPVIVDAFGFNYLAGLSRIGLALLDPPNDPDALARALPYYDELIERHPDTYGFLYNNAALAARDLGTAFEESSRAQNIEESERQQRLARAMELWEKSYAYYEKAVALEPDDARIVNDCGLVLIYHLHRDYARARELFEHAIAVGQPEIDALPEEAPVADRQLLEEAVGDAYQNIAIMLRQKGAAFAEYETFLESSVKYYPYDIRTAAALLRSRGEGRDPTQQTPQPAPIAPEKARALARVKQAAEAKAESGDFDGALLVLDGSAADLQGVAGYHELVGTYSLRYAAQARDGGGNASQIDGLYADAINQLKRSVELDNEPLEPRLELAKAYLDSGDTAAAVHTADKLLSHIAVVGGAGPEMLVAIHRVRAAANTRLYIAAVQAEQPGDDSLRKARSSLEWLEEQGALEAPQIQLWTSLEQWAGLPERAIEILARAMQREPDNEALIQQLVETASSSNENGAAVEALAGREDATGLWYRGRARFHLAQRQWIGGDNGAAIDTLTAAIADFEASKAENPDYAAAADQWTAFCLGSQGVIQIASGQTARAAKSLLRAAELSPAQVTAELDDTNTIKRSILVLGNKFYTDGDLGRAELLFRKAAAAVPQDSDFANNHGLMARDYGQTLERNGDTAKAAQMYEAAYESYKRASELEPDSIRLVNDCALMLIYHLDRDLDSARDMLQASIASGEARLKDDPPSNPAELRDLQEAVGDCYQNLGVYLERHGDDTAAAKAAFEKSMTFYPFDQRASAAHLLRLAEKGHEGGEGPGK